MIPRAWSFKKIVKHAGLTAHFVVREPPQVRESWMDLLTDAQRAAIADRDELLGSYGRAERSMEVRLLRVLTEIEKQLGGRLVGVSPNWLHIDLGQASGASVRKLCKLVNEVVPEFVADRTLNTMCEEIDAQGLLRLELDQ